MQGMPWGAGVHWCFCVLFFLVFKHAYIPRSTPRIKPRIIPPCGRTSHAWADFPYMGRLPVHVHGKTSLNWKTSDMWEGFPYTMERLPIYYGMTSHIREDCPHKADSHTWKFFPMLCSALSCPPVFSALFCLPLPLNLPPQTTSRHPPQGGVAQRYMRCPVSRSQNHPNRSIEIHRDQ